MATFGKGGLSDGAAPGQLCDVDLDSGKVDALLLEDASVRFDQPLSSGMSGLGHGLGELFEAEGSAYVFRRSAAGAVDNVRVFEAGIGITDGLDRKGGLPVVAEVVGVGEALQTAISQRPELRVLGVAELDPPLQVGDALAPALVVDLDSEVEEVIALEQHDGLNNLVKAS